MKGNIHTISYFKDLKTVQIILCSLLEACVCIHVEKYTYMCAYIYTRVYRQTHTYVQPHTSFFPLKFIQQKKRTLIAQRKQKLYEISRDFP